MRYYWIQLIQWCRTVWGVVAKFFFSEMMYLYWANHVKKLRPWMITRRSHDQISLAQNAMSKIGIINLIVFIDISLDPIFWACVPTALYSFPEYIPIFFFFFQFCYDIEFAPEGQFWFSYFTVKLSYIHVFIINLKLTDTLWKLQFIVLYLSTPMGMINEI